MAWRTAIMVFALSFTLPLAAFGQSPPFNQCPAVGNDTSCAILLVIEQDGSLRVKFDPAQGPFDGIEDTLFGVQNNSTKTIRSIPLSSPDPIFGFDGDGLCSQQFPNRPGGCPFGPTGYEGPGVSFAAQNNFTGAVNFTSGISPGGSAYFSLEERIGSLCSLPSQVQVLKQSSLPWKTDIYDDQSPSTMSQLGCYTTSGAMVINHAAGLPGPVTATTPRALNDWLNANDGYSSGGGVDGYAVAKYSREALHVPLWFVGKLTNRNDFILDQYVCHDQPVVLNVTTTRDHFIVATGQTTVGAQDTYAIADPGGNNSTLLGYGNQYKGLRLFSSTQQPLNALVITGHSPIELLLTGPDGKVTGFVNGETVNDIAGSSYSIESISDDTSPTGPSTPVEHIIEVDAPADGTYALSVIGTGSGPYKLDVVSYDVSGTRHFSQETGFATSGSTAKFTIQYSSTVGSVPTVTKIVTLGTLRSDVTAAVSNDLISRGIANSLLQKIAAVEAATARGNKTVAQNVLAAFVQEVLALPGRQIPTAVAQLLVDEANFLSTH